MKTLQHRSTMHIMHEINLRKQFKNKSTTGSQIEAIYNAEISTVFKPTVKCVFMCGASDNLYSPVTKTSLCTSSLRHFSCPGGKVNEIELTKAKYSNETKGRTKKIDNGLISETQSISRLNKSLDFGHQYGFQNGGRRGIKREKEDPGILLFDADR